jgi:hypothetical protein
MRLFKFGPAGREKCGVMVDGQRFSAARLFRDYDEKFFSSDGTGPAGKGRLER